MKHSSTRDLYGYWDQQRGLRATPDRSDIDPTAIPRVLADTFLLDADMSRAPTFRLAGTRVCALFCRELRDESFFGLFGQDSDRQMRELLGIVCDEQVATVAGVTAHPADASATELELLLLPLRHHGRTDRRILGTLVAITQPYWLGTIPVESLSLTVLRHIRPFVRPSAGSPSPLAYRAGRPRHGFLVYDGGRS